MAPVPESQQDGLLDRVGRLVEENKKVVLISAAVAAVGVGYYVYSTRAANGGPSSSTAAPKKKRGGSSKRKEKGVNDPDGPLLEEIRPQAAATAEEKTAEAEPERPLTDTEKAARAQSYKSQGNAAYQKREFIRAAELYTKAIDIAVTPEAVYFSNRAACYMQMQPPQYEKAVAGCDSALKLDNTYIKALNRRANALEALGRLEESLRDFTATTILERFQNETTTQALEKCLKKLAVTKTEELLQGREPRLPSQTFTSAYFSAFRPRPKPTLPEAPTQGDETFLLAWDALLAADYPHALTLTNEALSQGISSTENRAKALNLRGTFNFLVGETLAARADLQASLDLLPSFTQTWVKIASVHMELGEPIQAFEAFQKAIEYDERDPDIYYHRGQVHFITSDFDAASEDYNRSTALDDTFVFSHIQYAVAQYKKGEAETAKANFRKTMQQFPQSSEVLNYYGELLLDLQRYPDAIEKFEKAMEIERAKPGSTNVLPLVNKSLAVYQWKQDTEAAAALCEEAIALDPECDAAIATLGQLYLQIQRLDDAIDMFDKHSKIARTGPEVEQCLTFVYATKAQKQFSSDYPKQAAELEQLAKAMGAGMIPGMAPDPSQLPAV